VHKGSYTETMNVVYPIASVAELMGEPSRAAILVALLDGRALPAGELALISGLSAQSASGHLSKLVDGGLLSVRSEGRHRYYKIANPDVGHALEALGAIATVPRNSAPLSSREMTELRQARTCYDHLAGWLAVELTNALETSQVIRHRGERDYDLGNKGESWFAEIGVETATVKSARRSFARKCLDWTERRPHLAGALGAAFCARLIALGWVARRPKTRAMRITQRGEHEFYKRFGIAVS
jgi:DNA-binding transcriptional ArsR family regulator